MARPAGFRRRVVYLKVNHFPGVVEPAGELFIAEKLVAAGWTEFLMVRSMSSRVSNHEATPQAAMIRSNWEKL
jgi:hypothetical protein